MNSRKTFRFYKSFIQAYSNMNNKMNESFLKHEFTFNNETRIFQSVDVVQVQNIGKKAKNTYRCSKFSLHKNFKLSLDQNVA